ncbi:hypothetical protein I8752_18975 [Nostocaceae cyanobacterium CENA369]|uniref:Uncharacterized protein n=1 Tax=Dendronalium phyllosphericum CENA369 TaxID=1725256 RepID=A0A8J7LEL7_9NOST|nr:hypothetical protein [Dendronalium phyllosphericum]MBH8575062.1 hypothetical protein [Dendronalium phyllosphericum CENA369]
MIDERFSEQSFVKCGLDTDEARELSNLLAEEILKELKLLINSQLLEIIHCLNQLGHNIALYEEKKDYIGFCDNCLNIDNYYKLKIDFDIIIATGYAHLKLAMDYVSK